jgi:hypothetical protein
LQTAVPTSTFTPLERWDVMIRAIWTLLLVAPLAGCLVGAAVGATGAVVGAAVGVTGAAVGAGAKVTGAVIDAAIPDGDEDEDEDDNR